MNLRTLRSPMSVVVATCFGALVAMAQPLLAQCFNYSYNNDLIATDPFVSQLAFAGDVKGVAIVGDLAYVGRAGVGLVVVDVTDRAATKIVGTPATQGAIMQTWPSWTAALMRSMQPDSDGSTSRTPRRHDS